LVVEKGIVGVGRTVGNETPVLCRFLTKERVTVSCGTPKVSEKL